MTEDQEIRYRALELALKYSEVLPNNLVEITSKFENYIKNGHPRK